MQEDDTKKRLTEEELLEVDRWADVLYERRYGVEAPKCPNHGVKMPFRAGGVHQVPRAWGQHRTCTECGIHIMYRVPLTVEEYDKTVDKFGGRNYPPLAALRPFDTGELTDRLDSLGYLST